ncbi:hypothetical protein EXIGLDRAFT_734351 [Exidia glandulosa HHB12029]|uniref:F-box domain-containing protein n=1 Tax=Exidia glandulosa HHB12029 TaxID=1314781 RepID=A0A165K686_EXIGL|nr:hypothetical protein EXIGLDRAFT_734351 [Exidia glandulosa HHB12029]
MSFPIELLVDIFSRHKEPPALMSLALVCRQWKEIVYNDHSLWTTINVTPRTTLGQVRTQLARSGNRHLDVEVSFVPSMEYADFEDVLAAVFVETSRIETLEIGTLHTFGDDDDDELGDESCWPAAVERALCTGVAWPQLRVLDLEGEMVFGDTLEIDIFAPTLVRLRLDCVSVREWAQLLRGTQLRDLDLGKAISGDMFELMMVLPNLTNLRRLGLNDNTDGDETLVFSLPHGKPPVFLHLVAITVYWETADISSLLSFLGCCPSLEQLEVMVTSVVNQDPTASNPVFKLPRLESLRLVVSGGNDRTSSDFLNLLAPALCESKLRDVDLDNMSIRSLEVLLNPHLERLRLKSVVCDPRALTHGLVQCTNLRVLELREVEMPSLGDAWTSDVRLSRLRSATLVALEADSRLRAVAAPDRLAHNRRLPGYFIPLVDSPGVMAATVQGVPLTVEEMLRLMKDLGNGGMLFVESHNTFYNTPGLKIGAPLRSDEAQYREFEVSGLVDAWRSLHSAYNILWRIGSLGIDICHLTEFFKVVLSESLEGAQLPLLFRLTICAGYMEGLREDKLESTLDDVGVLCASPGAVDAPYLLQVVFDNSAYEEDPLQVSQAALTRFISLFKAPFGPEVIMKAVIRT